MIIDNNDTYEDVVKKWRDDIELKCDQIISIFGANMPIQTTKKENGIELQLPDYDYLIRPIVHLLCGSVVVGMKHNCKFKGPTEAKDFLDDMKHLINGALDIPEVRSILEKEKQYTNEQILDIAAKLSNKGKHQCH